MSRIDLATKRHRHAMAGTLAIRAASAVPSGADEVIVETSGPQGPLQGAYRTPEGTEETAPVVVIVPGSGPVDRDGNIAPVVAAGPYRLLAEALTERGIASLRIDKRGLHGSAAAVADPNAVTVADYAGDVLGWLEAIGQRGSGQERERCMVLLGHSEGGIVALAAAARMPGLCGVVLLATPGRPFLIDLMALDPAAMAAAVAVPMLIVQGDRDLQVTTDDARRLAAEAPRARLVTLLEMNHVLKSVPDDVAANLASCADPALPPAPGLIEAIANFVEEIAVAEPAPGQSR